MSGTDDSDVAFCFFFFGFGWFGGVRFGIGDSSERRELHRLEMLPRTDEEIDAERARVSEKRFVRLGVFDNRTVGTVQGQREIERDDASFRLVMNGLKEELNERDGEVKMLANENVRIGGMGGHGDESANFECS